MEKGRIIQVIGPVIDVEFSGGKLPMIKDALTVESGGKKRVSIRNAVMDFANENDSCNDRLSGYIFSSFE